MSSDRPASSRPPRPASSVPAVTRSAAPTAVSTSSAVAMRLGDRLTAMREELVARWLDRLAARVALETNTVFPSDELLNHVPLLIDGIAAYVADAGSGADLASGVVAKARELGALRYEQGFDAYEIMKEYEILGAILLTFAEEEVETICANCPRAALVHAVRRVADAVQVVRQATSRQFLELASARVNAREAQLRRFNRMVAHELKNHVAALRNATMLLGEPWLPEVDREKFIAMAQRNAAGMQDVLENLEALSRAEVETRQQRNVLLPQAVAEVVRQFRDAAAANGVRVHIAPDLPSVEVHAAAVELVLRNYLSNAIKYADPAASDRWVGIGGEFIPKDASGHGGELVVHVRDNGIGVPVVDRDRLFEPFFRASDTVAKTGAPGSGLGLSLVRDTIEALSGRVWAEFPAYGTSVFGFALPSRRDADAAAAGTTRATLSS